MLSDADGLMGSASGNFCAVLESGGAACWGEGGFGELGDGVISDAFTPVAIQGVGGVGSVIGVNTIVGGDNYGSYGAYSTCADLNTGEVDCWGYGGDGELGNGAIANSDDPVAVEGQGKMAELWCRQRHWWITSGRRVTAHCSILLEAWTVGATAVTANSGTERLQALIRPSSYPRAEVWAKTTSQPACSHRESEDAQSFWAPLRSPHCTFRVTLAKCASLIRSSTQRCSMERQRLRSSHSRA